MKLKLARATFILPLLLFPLQGPAQITLSSEVGDVSTQTPPVEEVKPERIVITDKEREDFVINTAAPHKVSKEKLELYKYTDVNRALRQTAGVYFREEDGQGLRPNIGLRGTNPDRSKKVSILEDGILIGPAPYSAPAAYYTPSMNHTQSLEIFKGFAAVPYGPNSIGGSVNYVTTAVPTTFAPRFEGSTGAFNTQNIKISAGDSLGGGGYLVEASHFASDGFKKLDNGGPTGFNKNEVLLKGKVKLTSAQELETRLGYSNEDSHETYLGLSSTDLRQSPYGRYSASSLDEMKWNHSKAQVQHNLQLGESSQLKTTLYRHDFERLWNRLDGFRNNNVSIFDVLRDPATHQVEYMILSGQEDSAAAGGRGDLIVVGNQRTFYSQGAQTQWNTQFDLGPTSHDFEMGLRFHQDQIRRNHSENTYSMTGGQMANSGIPQQMRDINRNKATALTLNMVENVKYGDFVFTALGRVERVDFDYRNTLDHSQVSRTDDVFAPGAALLYNFNDTLSFKTSVNRGVSVAGLDDRGSEAKEESVNYEMGLKYLSRNGNSQAEIIGFVNDYSNITGTCSSSTGCASNQLDLQFSGGRALIQGVEARVAQNLIFGALSVPLQLNLTAINAEFKNSFESRTAEWGAGLVRAGDPLPYIPQIQYSFTAGTAYKKTKQEFAFIYQGESYDQSARQGRLAVPAYGIVDWTGRYEFNKQTQLFARIDNLLGKDYVVSYKPYGARPGKPQSFMIGFSHTF